MHVTLSHCHCHCHIVTVIVTVFEFDAERAAEMTSLAEAQDRLQRLEAEQAALTSVPQEPQGPAQLAPEIASLRAKLAAE